MSRPFHCPHCRRSSQLVTPSPWTAVLVALAWVNAAVLVLCAAMLGPLILVVLPALFACGAGLVTGAHALAGEPVHCARCEKIVVAGVLTAPRTMPAPARLARTTL